MKNQPIRKLLMLAFCLVMLSACQTATAPAPSPWIDVILNDPDCAPPCWNGITPGVTTMDEAWAIIQAEPGLIDLVYSGGETSRAGIDWTFSNADGWGTVYSSSTDYSTVYKVCFFQTSGHFPLFSLEEALEYLGEPDVLYLHIRSGLGYVANLYYPQSGIDMDLFFIRGPWYSNRIEVLPDNGIGDLCFSRPFPRDEDNSQWLDWEGYGIYKFEEGWIKK
jgi:hypothetical protein